MKQKLLWGCLALVSMQLSAGNFYVKKSATAAASGNTWEAATTLTDALSKANDDDVIHIAAGIYAPTVAPDPVDSVQLDVKTKSFTITKNIKLIGGYPENATAGAVADPISNTTVLSGELGGVDFAYHIMLVAAEQKSGKKVELSGLLFTAGAANNAAMKVGVDGKTFMCNKGGAIVASGAVLNIDNCQFIGNSAKDDAGAVFYYGGAGQVTNSLFEGNTSIANYGALKIYDAAVDVKGCQFKDNVASKGGAIAVCSGAVSLLDKNTFTNNRATATGNENGGTSGGSIYVENGSDCTVSNSTFTGGKGFNGGMIAVNAYPKGEKYVNVLVQNCTFEKSNFYDTSYEKSRLRGGVIFVDGNNKPGSLVTFKDCKMIECRANIGGIGFVTNKGKLIVDGCEVDRPRGSTQSPAFETNLEGTHLIIKDCYIHDAIYGPEQGWNMMLIAAGGLSRIDLYNSLLENNLARNIDDKGVEQDVQKKSGACFSTRSGGLLNAVNCTMTGNQGRNLFYVAEEKANASGVKVSSRMNIVSCTVFRNNTIDNPNICELVTYGTPTTALAYFYNSIISGNIIASTGNECVYGRSVVNTCIYGAESYDDKAQPIITEAFDIDFGLLDLADNGGKTKTFEVAEDDMDFVNPASRVGMAKDKLIELAATLDLDADLLSKDQRGAERNGKFIGAYTAGTVSGMDQTQYNTNQMNVFGSNGDIIIKAEKLTRVSIFSIDNRLVRELDVTEGSNTVSGLANGCYIVVMDGKGIVVTL